MAGDVVVEIAGRAGQIDERDADADFHHTRRRRPEGNVRSHGRLAVGLANIVLAGRDVAVLESAEALEWTAELHHKVDRMDFAWAANSATGDAALSHMIADNVERSRM